MFDVRIVNVDHYMAAPFRGLDPVYSDFRGSSISQVPVIRIFGSTASGKKTCLHIHGVFPYIYVPFDGESHPSHQGYQLAASLDKALNIALGTANSSRQHIFKVVHVKGVPFYGYHEKSHQFLKIYFYNPLIVKKATDLLQNGAVCNKIFQCHESHLPFILQFFIDYNLHGMSFIQLASVEFRQEPGALHHSDLESNPRPAKTTYCELEVDGLASDILNRKTISDGEVANPGLAGIWSEERLRNDVSQLSQNQSQERYGAKKTLSEVLLRQRLREALEQLSDRISGGSARSVVYPAESTPGEHVHDASLVEGFCNNCTELGLPTLTVNLDDSVIDEQLVLSLSQAPTNSQDHSLLDIMQSLAERGLGSPENEEDWLTCSTQKKGEALLSQSFHCENMEGDSVLGVSPNEVAEDECPQRLSTDETVEKEDCWQDSFWNGLDSNDIPQLDGAPDECDESLEDSGRDTPSIRRLTRRRNQDKTILNSISNNPSRVSSPIVIDSSEDESFSNMDCASMNIFNQERFWCVKKENIDNELKNLMLADTMAPASTLKSVMYDESPDVFTGDTNVCGNVDSTYANVLMHGDPSLTSLAEVTSDDNFISSNLNESNCEFPESEPNDNSKNKLSLEENGLDIPLSSRETCLELGDDSADIVASSEFMFNLDYEYSTFEDQEIIDEENDASSESVTKRKPKKSNKPDRTRLKNHYSQSKIEANLGKRKQDRPNNHNKGKTANCNGKQLKTENVDTENKRRIDENVSKQDDVELNNNEMKSKQDRKKETRINRKSSESMEFEESFKTPQKAIKNSENVEAENKKIKTKSKQMNENRSAKSVDEKSDLELKINRKTPKKTRKCSENVDEAENIESKKICKNMKENRLPKSCDENSVDMEFKISRTAVKKCRKSSKNVEEDGLQSVCPSSSENMESQSMKMKKAGNAGDDHDITDDDHDISDDDYNDVDGDGDDDDDDVDLFRITLKKKREGDFKTQILNQSFLETLTSSAISTEVELESKENGQNDTKEFFPCYFFKSNGVAMKFNFPFKRRILNEKTKKCIEERRKKFAFILIPKVDYRVELSHVEDGYLTTDMIEGYGNHKSNEELSSSVNLSVSDSTYLVSNGSPSPKKRKTSEIINPMKNVDTFSPSPRTSIKYRNEQLSPNRNFCHVLKHSSSRQDSMKLDANNSVCLPEKSKKAKKSMGFGLKSKANGDSAQMYDPLSSKLRFTEQFYSPENKKCSSPIKAKLTQSKASLIKAARKQSNGSDAFELCENDINSPNKIKSPNASTNWRATGASPHKNVTPIKTGKNIIMKSPNKTEEQSLNSSFIFLDELEPLDMSPSNNCMKQQDLSNKFDKNEKISPKSRKSLKKNELIRLNNIKPCRVVVDKLPENLDGIKNLAMGKSCAQGKKIENSHPKLKQNNSVELESKLLNCSTIEKSSPVDLVVDPESSVCSEKKLDFLQVPFSDVEVDKNSLEPGRKDTYNFSMTVGKSPIDLKLSVRLDRIDQSVFSKINRSQGTFKIDNLDGSFGDDIETSSSSSDDDVGIAFSGKFMKSKDSASNSDGKISHNSLQVSTPRPRYKPLKVKILKSPPKKTKSVPKCWVIVKKLDLCTVKGSSSNTVPSSLGYLGDSKNPNLVNDAASSHGALSGSDDSDIFGEIFSQRETKKETKLEVECNKEACVGLESSASKIVSDTSQKAELNLDIVGICSGRVVGESIKDQLLDDCENNNSSGEEKISLCRVASPIEPVILDGKTENAMKQNNIAIPGPSTSYAQPWSNANVYETCSSSENEDNGVLSFYNMSVYIPGNDSNSDKSATYEIHSQIDECSNFSSEEQKVYIPKIKPPTQNEILSSLSKCGLSKVLNTEPFCSDLSDRTSTEVGPVSLKLKSRTAIDLEEYDGSFSKGICMYRNNLLKSLRVKRSSVLASDRSVVLFPLKRPPTCTEVRKWLKVKSTIERESRNVVEDEKCEKLERLIVPCSPGQNYSLDDEENTLILTPMTPPCRSHSTPSDCPPNGSLSATETPVCTPVPFAQTRCAKRKSSNIIEKSSAKLLKDFAAMSSIKENDEDYVLCEKDDKNVQLSESSICISNETREKMEAQLKKKARLSSSFQIETCNSDSTSGLPTRVENLQKTRSQIQHQFLTLMILELHVQTRGDLLPDPENDPIRAIFYHIVNDVPEPSEDVTALTGIIAVGNLVPEDDKVLVTCATDEMSLLSALVELIRKWDPDMFIGYEIEKLSWGYLIERAYTLGMNLNIELSRVIGVEGSSKYEDEQGMLGGDSEQLDIRLAGRIVLNIWRLLRHEVALQSYTFENIMYHVLRRRIPLFSFRSLSAWWEHRTKQYRWMTVEHYLVRVRGIAEILDHLDLIGRTSELARLFGIQFYEVLSRGSQFRVESMMLRMAKPENYVAVSPTTKQRAHMRAPESLPLIMEPESRFYSDPVIVLDFQSLYPSIIIAYNYCFSTCLGRVNNLAKSEFFDFGCTHLRVPFSTVKKLEENLTFSPCGVAFVDSSVRRGVLPRMLQEILETRLMVKRSMKKNKNNKALHKVLHNRQLGLKLIANVTYGYTSANFSGRMPCIEIGDSVVSKGRETLERAIALVNKTEKWGARVVYGDTDSLFVLVAGRSRAEAFQIGAEIAEAVTAENPKPVKLKLEKVYQPCILQTKKRYVGHMWESPDQETPTYDAKGIETVRRDGCPAVAKILQKSLQLLFETKDVSIVKRFILHQFGKVSSGRISIQELTFAREYRGARGYKPGACVPALELARSWMKKDRRSEPRVGERVPYVVVSGPPGLPLIRLVRSPRAVLADPALKINADYYITRVIIPPLNRCLLLVGANAHNWFNSMPRRQPPSLPSAVTSGIKKATISQYFATVSCAVCHDQTTTGLCNNCRARPQSVAVSLATQLHSWERRRQLVLKVCQSCCGRTNNIDCVSLDCPVLYSRADVERDLAHEPVYRQLQHTYFNCDF